MFRFGWSEAIVGASLAFVGVIMAVSQATVPRLLTPRIGEAACATLGLASGCLGFLGYGLASRGWMMFALMFTWFLAAIVMPSSQALMSHRIPPTAQGELQGGVASLYSLSSIIGPPLMTQLFGYFSSDAAPIHLPGAAFLFAAALTGGSLILFRRAVRVEHPQSARGPRELLEGSPAQPDQRARASGGGAPRA
jgi:DHA1 family tetracycline resistance protein-like MFS transporter